MAGMTDANDSRAPDCSRRLAGGCLSRRGVAAGAMARGGPVAPEKGFSLSVTSID